MTACAQTSLQGHHIRCLARHRGAPRACQRCPLETRTTVKREIRKNKMNTPHSLYGRIIKNEKNIIYNKLLLNKYIQADEMSDDHKPHERAQSRAGSFLGQARRLCELNQQRCCTIRSIFPLRAPHAHTHWRSCG